MKRLLFILIGLVFLMIPVLSQGDSIVPVDPTLPVDVFDALNLQKWLLTFAALVGVSTFFTTFLNGLFKVEKSLIRKLIGWVVCVILVVIGKLFTIGFVGELTWLMAFITAALGGLGANGLFDVPGLQALLYLIESLLGNIKARKKLEELRT